jgi:hypothetical protein
MDLNKFSVGWEPSLFSVSILMISANFLVGRTFGHCT